uniref:Peptidase A1 domain-containing protein n=1 Tax=Oryza punctata TaxID=4537 RepID=A0A0E0LSD3_ORYPU
MDAKKFKSPFRMHEDVVYLAEMEIGEQQQKQYLMIDTGSSLVWTQRYDYQPKFRMVFGCAHQERIALTTVKDCTGILGLDRKTRFSYCAPPRMPSISRRDSWLHFGSHAQISGKKVPLVIRWGKYYLTLTAITYKYNILMSPVPVIAYKSRKDYLHTMVDTGPSLQTLPSSSHDDQLKEIDAIIKSENVVKAGTSSWPRHSYLGTMDNVKDITVTLSFEGAANRVDDSSKAILGMFAQTTINVEYDLLRGEIAMDPIRCAR